MSFYGLSFTKTHCFSPQHFDLVQKGAPKELIHGVGLYDLSFTKPLTLPPPQDYGARCLTHKGLLVLGV